MTKHGWETSSGAKRNARAAEIGAILSALMTLGAVGDVHISRGPE